MDLTFEEKETLKNEGVLFKTTEKGEVKLTLAGYRDEISPIWQEEVITPSESYQQELDAMQQAYDQSYAARLQEEADREVLINKVNELKAKLDNRTIEWEEMQEYISKTRSIL